MVATMFLVLFISSCVLGTFGLKLEHCPAGFYCAKSMRRSFPGDGGYEMPQACPRGMFSGAAAVECTNCSTGYYTWDEASPFCERCEAGYMCPAANVDPQPCPLGTYNLRPAQACCQVCGSGSYTSRIASTGCIRCRPGTFCPRNEIQLACATNANA